MDRRLKYMEKETLFYLNYEYGNIYRIENYEDYKDEKNLQSLSRTFYNGLFGLEIGNREILPPIYSSINYYYKRGDYRPSLDWLIVEKDNKFGLMKCSVHSCEFCLEVIYDKIIKLEESYNYNKMLELRRAGFKGIYNLEKNMMIPCIYNEIKKTPYGHLVELNGLKGVYFDSFISTPCSYDEIDYTRDNYKHANYLIVSKNNYKGIYCNEREVLPAIYDSIEILNDGRYKVVQEGKVGIYSNEKAIIPTIFDSIEDCWNGTYKTKLNEKIGIYKNECEIIPTIYDDIIILYKGFIIQKGGFYGLITDDNKIIEPQYENIKRLCFNYYAILQLGKWGIIENNNKLIISPKYEDIEALCYESKFNNMILFNAKLKNYWGTIDIMNNIIIPFKYDYITTSKNNIYGRIGRIYYLLNKGEEFKSQFLSDYSCGYDNSNSSIFEFDKDELDLCVN